jgi:sigma-B regulation protein RsbU (phosphoserine phosphatase)
MATDFLVSLSQNRLVQGLTEAQLRRIAGVVRPRSFAAGDTIIHQSDTPDTVYLITEGSVQVSRALPGTEAGAIAEMGPGEFCGEMAVITGASRHSASVRARTEVRALELASSDFTRLLDDVTEVSRNILTNIIRQLQGVNNRWLETLRAEKEQLEQMVRERTRALEKAGERVRRELTIAQNIQRNLLPEKRISYPGIAIATEYIPCTELGGDITGVFPIDETRIGIYGGDVCGHGIYAAMVMSYVKKLVETSVKRILLNRQYVVKPPGAVLTTINHSFITEISQGDPEIYLTLFLGVLDIGRLSLEFSSAGTHCPPLVLTGGEASPLFTQSDFPIGHVPDHEYATSRRTFAPGDAFLFASDGVIEARRGEETFSMERLRQDALRIRGQAGRLDLDEIVKSVRCFLGGEPPQDDMCLLTIDFTAVDQPGS